MNYEKVLRRAWSIVWEHKFLIILGALVALGSGTPGNQVSWRVNGDGNGDFDFGALPGIDGEMFRQVAIPLIVLAVGVLFAIALVVWVISLVARGGLIASVDTIETGGASYFAMAWSAGWQRAGRLIGIGLVPAIPVLILVIVGLMGADFFVGFMNIMNGNVATPAAAGVGSFVLLMACIAAPLAFGLSLLRIFAERACVLEGLGVFDSYRRGWDVATANLGAAVLFFVIQVAISLGLGIALFIPGIVMALCFLLWPVLLLVQGTIAAYFSTMWTLAWREWTGVGAIGEFIPREVPAA